LLYSSGEAIPAAPYYKQVETKDELKEFGPDLFKPMPQGRLF
jgi:hypothetical protein